MTHLRTGRKVGLHLYEQTGPNPADDDPPVGTVFTPELAATIVAAVNAAHDRTNGGYDPRAEVNAHWGHDREELIALWKNDQERRTAYAEYRVKQARRAEANQWERRLAEELEARDAERDETVTGLATELAEARASERARIRAAIEAEIDDHDPDHTFRELADSPQTGQGDPGHAGNSWWRAYVHVGGLLHALACTEPEGAHSE